MKQNASSRRVNEQARQVIAEIVMFELSDPRLSMVTITGCEVSFDRSFCNVFYTTDPQDYEKAQVALQNAAGKIRSEMAKRLSWRTAPELRFFLDKSVDEGQKITEAINREQQRYQAMAQDESNEEA